MRFSRSHDGSQRPNQLLLAGYIVAYAFSIRATIGHRASLTAIAIALVMIWLATRQGSDSRFERLSPTHDGLLTPRIVMAGLSIVGAGILGLDLVVLVDLGASGIPWASLAPVFTGMVASGAVVFSSRHGWLGLKMFLGLYAVLGIVVILGTPNAGDIDVLRFQNEASDELLAMRNPYTMQFADPYDELESAQYYGPGVSIDGVLQFGYPYPPVSLVASLPGRLLGDARFSSVAITIAAAWLLGRLARDPCLGVTAMLLPNTIVMWTLGWTETSSVALLTLAVLLVQRGRSTAAGAMMGLFFLSKQYLWPLAPLVWLMRLRLDDRRFLRAAVIAPVALTVPFLLWSPREFFESVVTLQFRQPLRTDSLSVVAEIANVFGVSELLPLTSTITMAAIAVGVVMVLVRGERSLTGLTGGIAFATGLIFVTAKQAFLNYYFFLSWCALIAAASAFTTHGRSEVVDEAGLKVVE